MILFSLWGPYCCPQNAWPKPTWARSPWSDQWGCQEWFYLLPWVLQHCSQEVQRGGWGSVQANYVQGELHKLHHMLILAFQALCGTKPYPDNIKAKKYKLHENFFTKTEFFNIMRNLPEEVRKNFPLMILIIIIN